MTLLSDKSIRERSESNGLIYPYSEDQLQPCSYDVTLGPTIIRFIGSGEIDAASRSLNRIEYFRFDIPEIGYILDPGEFILGSTNEGVSIPSDIAARYEGKSSLGRLGLASHITAGFIDPGFRGDITLEIKNENNHPIRIKSGMAIGQLCFFTVDQNVERPYGSKDLGSHYFDQIGPTVSRM